MIINLFVSPNPLIKTPLFPVKFALFSFDLISMGCIGYVWDRSESVGWMGKTVEHGDKVVWGLGSKTHF